MCFGTDEHLQDEFSEFWLMAQSFLDLDMVETVHYSLSPLVQNFIMYSTSVPLFMVESVIITFFCFYKSCFGFCFVSKYNSWFWQLCIMQCPTGLQDPLFQVESTMNRKCRGGGCHPHRWNSLPSRSEWSLPPQPSRRWLWPGCVRRPSETDCYCKIGITTMTAALIYIRLLFD